MIIYNAHNDDAYHFLRAPSSNLTTMEFVHSYSYSNMNLYTHTISCAVCGEKTAEGYTWADATPSGYYCTVCGYMSNVKPEIIHKVDDELYCLTLEQQPEGNYWFVSNLPVSEK